MNLNCCVKTRGVSLVIRNLDALTLQEAGVSANPATMLTSTMGASQYMGSAGLGVLVAGCSTGGWALSARAQAEQLPVVEPDEVFDPRKHVLVGGDCAGYHV